MGISDAIEGASGQQSGSTNAKVVGGLMQALDEHPGGLAGVMDQFRQNGLGDHVQNWASGQGQTATPAQVQQGLGGTGLINNVAARAGVSPEMAKMAMAVVLPMVMSHFTQGGQQSPPQSGFGGMTSQILSKFAWEQGKKAKRSPAVENGAISREELACMAIKLRNDLFNYEDKLGSCRDFAELMNSASALVVAILEPVEFRLSADPPKKTAQMYQFTPGRASIPSSLH